MRKPETLARRPGNICNTWKEHGIFSCLIVCAPRYGGAPFLGALLPTLDPTESHVVTERELQADQGWTSTKPTVLI